LPRRVHDLLHVRSRARDAGQGRPPTYGRRVRRRLVVRRPDGGVDRSRDRPRSGAGARTMTAYLGVIVAGALGAPLRYLVDSRIHSARRGGFPFGTLVVSVSGSLVLGAVTGL